MNIRPHHILCIQNYIGYGYNEEFTAHMDRIAESLVRSVEVVMHEGCDDICTACPHNKGGRCTSLDKVDRMDREVLAVCDLKYGDRLNWNEAASLAKEKIFETEEFSRICGNCQWYDTCRKIRIGISRIEKYEKIMQDAERMLGENREEEAGILREKIEELEAYYESAQWKSDFAADEAGRLPKGLRRGVLSEDGLFNLLERYREQYISG